MNDEWPYLPAVLIQKLNEVCPERCAKPDETLEQIHNYAGKREMVRFLIRLYEEQNHKEA